jgi:serine/threonine-protein kinase
VIAQSIGSYRIVEKVGQGGMGEVYRAHDSKLHRDVALKVLLPSVAHDPDRLARFSREAQLLASLNHPHIAQVFGLEESGDVGAIVMEFVEGPTLADRLARRAIPADEALTIARQIALALEAAHEQGVVHRDLKPANVKIRPDGTAKVLDFGLAKALEAGPSSPTSDHQPTVTSPAVTARGVILGTAAYMAPEQARGHTVDRRADLWAFGCVLFEMLTGRRAFEGDTVSDTIAAVLTREPEWTALPATTPAAVRRLLRRCLAKQASRRLDSAAAARLEIDEADWSEPVPSRTVLQRAAPVALAFALGGLLATGVAMWAGSRPAIDAPRLAGRFDILPPRTRSLALSYSDRTLALSPDGRYIVYRTGATLRQLVVHPVDRTEGAVLPGIVDARAPFFSADGQWIGYFDGSGLKKVPTTGGASVTIVAATGVAFGASWGEDDSIVFATQGSGGLQRVSAGGGEPVPVTTADSTNGETHRHPWVLPGGRGFLFTVWKGSYRTGTAVARVAVFDARTGQYRVLIDDGAQAAYVDGTIVYLAGGALRAVRFGLERLELVGNPVPLAENPWIGTQADFAVSQSGTLVYIPAYSAERSLVWVDRAGQETSIPAPPRLYEDVRLSPDGTRAALAIRDQEDDIWLWDFRRGGPLTRLTFNPRIDERPVWTHDGQTVVFGSLRDSDRQHLYAQAADGTGSVEQLTIDTQNGHAPAFVARDGTGVLGVEYSQGPSIAWFRITRPLRPSLNSASAVGVTHVEPLIDTAAAENNPDVSPDGRYIAYQSNESGRFEIWVRPFPRVDAGRWQVSTEGGTRPIWGRDGKELFFLDAANRLTAVLVQPGGNAFRHGRPVTVFNATYVDPYDADARPFDAAPDGRFLMVKENATARLAVVVNAIEELKAKVPIP